MAIEKSFLEESKNIKKEVLKQNCPSFSISKYIMYVILPKCTMVHGEVISSVYLQISVNINHRKNVKKWQEKKCWMNVKTIARITGYHFRTVHYAIQVLEDLNLIEKSYHGKLKMFQLKNENLVNPNDIYEFIKFSEKKLLELAATKEKKEKHSLKFEQLNLKYYLFSPLHLQQLSKKVWFPNINLLRSQLSLAESTYKGSSLFFINIISQDLFKKQNSKTNNSDISEADRSLLLGCSQSTLNRYITAYENADIIKREKSNTSHLSKLTLGNFNSKENSKQRVVANMENFICSICSKEFKSKRALSMHISKSKDEQHVSFKKNNAKQNTSTSTSTSTSTVLSDQMEDKYMDIPCECTMSCKSCFKEWRKDFFDDCKHERKSAFMEEYKIDINSIEIVEKAKTKTKSTTTTKKVEGGFENVPSIKKGPSPDTAPGLVKYFYDLTGGMSPNWSKESKQVKNLLTNKNKPLAPDEIRIVLSHMSRKGYTDLRFLGTSVNDALLEQKYIKEMEQEGTPAYLVKKFYNGHGLQINMQTLIKDVQRIQETINSGLNYQDTNLVIEYMIETKCSVLNFIGSKRNEALLNKKKSSQPMVKTASSIKNNPSFYDQDDLTILRDELLGGRLHIKKVSIEHKSAIIDIAKQIFKENKFNQRYTSFEWAWRVGLELDEEMYNIALLQLNKQTSLQYAMLNSSKLSQDKINMLQKLNMKFDSWVQKQHEMFGKNIQNLQLEKSDLN